MASSVYGRFVLEQDGDGVRLRVRTTDALPWVWMASLAAYGVAVIAAGPLLSHALLLIVLLFGMLGLLLVAVLAGMRRGLVRALYGRLTRSVELRQYSKEVAGDAFRRHDGQASLVIDGRAFSKGDLVGVVIMCSTERKKQDKYRSVPIERYRPTIVMRDCAFELGVFEETDEADAHALADALATALAGRDERAPAVRWSVPDPEPDVAVFVPVGLLLGVYGLCVALSDVWHGPAVMASLALAVYGAAVVWASDRVARTSARARSRPVRDVVAAARAAVARDHVPRAGTR